MPPAITRAASGLPSGDHSIVARADAADDEAIPRAFLAVADLVVLGAAFVLSRVAAPPIQRLLLPGGPLHISLGMGVPFPAGPSAVFPPLASVLWVLAATAPTTLVFMELLGGYRSLLSQSLSRVFVVAGLSQAIAISFTSLVVFALKSPASSRVLIFTYGLLSAVGLLAYRAGLWTYQRRRLAAGAYAKNVLLVGHPRAVGWLIQHFADHLAPNQFRLAGWLAVESEDRRRPAFPPQEIAVDQVPLVQLGMVDDLGPLLVHHPVHEIIAVQSSVHREWLPQVIDLCDYFRVRLRIVPDALLVGDLHDLQIVYRGDPLRLPEVVLAPPDLQSDALFLKRLIDVVVSAVMLVVLLPLFVLIGIAIKLTTPSLPVFYPWRVVGLKGLPFTGFKFTTMTADADDRREGLLARNEMLGPVFKIRDDPRITPLGRILRKFSLNELPQLWSVFKGDMSLVGPRPAFRHELERYELWHKRKLCVKPGLTCLWQVSGRNRINNFDDWVRLDLEYIDRWSLWLDMKILVRTLWTVVRGSGS
jgi:exopolysaccharide biosynthesis polyprenyl glycosylphosphotransferase